MSRGCTDVTSIYLRDSQSWWPSQGTLERFPGCLRTCEDKGQLLWSDLLGQLSQVPHGCRLKSEVTFTSQTIITAAFLASGKIKGLFLINEGRSLIPSLKELPFAKGNPMNEWVALMNCLWLRGLRAVPQNG